MDIFFDSESISKFQISNYQNSNLQVSKMFKYLINNLIQCY